MASGTNTTPESDALQWVLDYIGDVNHVTGKSWTSEERLYINELKELKRQYSRYITPYRPAS